MTITPRQSLIRSSRVKFFLIFILGESTMTYKKISEYVMQNYLNEYKYLNGKLRANFINKAYGNKVCDFADLGYDEEKFFNDLLKGKEIRDGLEATYPGRS